LFGPIMHSTPMTNSLILADAPPSPAGPKLKLSTRVMRSFVSAQLANPTAYGSRGPRSSGNRAVGIAWPHCNRNFNPDSFSLARGGIEDIVASAAEIGLATLAVEVTVVIASEACLDKQNTANVGF